MGSTERKDAVVGLCSEALRKAASRACWLSRPVRGCSWIRRYQRTTACSYSMFSCWRWGETGEDEGERVRAWASRGLLGFVSAV